MASFFAFDFAAPIPIAYDMNREAESLLPVGSIRVLPEGAVSVVTRCEFRTSMRVHRLPLTVVLPADVFAGMPFTVVQAGGERRVIKPW